MSSQLRLAYITTNFPSISHTFILREVGALRRRGAEIHTISLRRTAGEHLLASENREASQTTYSVRPPRWRDLLAAHLGALLRHPLAYLITLRESLRLARPGLRGRLWQVFYFGEAILVWHRCSPADIRHIHAHHGSPPADVALLVAQFGALAGRGPSTWSLTIHGSVEFWNVSAFRLAEKIRRALAVVCISDFARSQLMALVDEAHWPKLHVIHCGVAPGEYPAPCRPAAARPTLLHVGRFVPEKGHGVLLRALALLRRWGCEAELVLVGSGPAQAQLEQLSARLGLSQRVTFAGGVSQDEIGRYYAKASVFCLPSFAEGVPVVLMEAMAHGCPVVATAVGGVRELVRDGDTGLLVTPGRADELARAIASLLDSQSLRERLAGAGRRYVARNFDIERSAIQLEHLFGRILDPLARYEPRAAQAAVPAASAGAFETLSRDTARDPVGCDAALDRLARA